MSVFRYNIFFEGDTDKQERYVVAETEQEAEQKMEAYRQQMIKDGFSDFTYCGGWVEIYGVIV